MESRPVEPLEGRLLHCATARRYFSNRTDQLLIHKLFLRETFSLILTIQYEERSVDSLHCVGFFSWQINSPEESDATDSYEYSLMKVICTCSDRCVEATGYR